MGIPTSRPHIGFRHRHLSFNPKPTIRKLLRQYAAVYKPDNVTRTKCPACGKFMLLVSGKRGKMLTCPDRACGHRQPEKEDESGFKSSRQASRVNQKLIAQYSDGGSVGTNLGDMLKAAMAGEKEEKKEKPDAK